MPENLKHVPNALLKPRRSPLNCGAPPSARALDCRLPRRRFLALLALLLPGFTHASPALQGAMQRARELRDAAVRAGDQPYGAVVLRGSEIVGEGPSRVVSKKDHTAHAEREAIRDALRRLGSTGAKDLAGCVLVSTSRPCGMCEAAAANARIARMVHGDQLTDAGPPR